MKTATMTVLIKRAGGASAVAQALGVSRITIWVWSTKGFPHTEWSGYTNHSVRLSKFFKKKGIHISPDKLRRMAGA